MNMYVSNLSFHTNDAALRTLFSAYGSVSSAKVITDRESGRTRRFGFVEMKVVAEAEAAMKGLDRKEVEGRAISVNAARVNSARETTSLKKRTFSFWSLVVPG